MSGKRKYSISCWSTSSSSVGWCDLWAGHKATISVRHRGFPDLGPSLYLHHLLFLKLLPSPPSHSLLFVPLLSLSHACARSIVPLTRPPLRAPKFTQGGLHASMPSHPQDLNSMTSCQLAQRSHYVRITIEISAICSYGIQSEFSCSGKYIFVVCTDMTP